MSIRVLKKRFAGRLGRFILFSLIVVIGLGMVVLFSSGGGYLGEGRRQQGSADQNEVIATVNGQPLTRAEFDAAYQQTELDMRKLMAQYGLALGGGIERVWTNRLEALQMAEQNAVIMQDAKAKGINISSREVRKKVDELVDQGVNQLKAQAKAQKPEQLEQMYAYYATQIGGVQQQQRMSERKFRGWYRDYLWQTDRTQLELQLASDRLKNMVTPKRPMTEEEARASFDEVTSRQIIVALKPVGKPARTEADAKQRAEALLARIRGGEDFGAVARVESDYPEARTTGGLMDSPMQIGGMDAEWKRQIAPLQAGQVVKEPIKTAYGYILVKVEKRESKLPPEFEKNKQQEMGRLAGQEQDRAWDKYTGDLLAKAAIKVTDPELLGYQALREGRTDEGLKLLEQASLEPEKLGPGAAAVFYQMAVFYSAKNDWAKAAEMYGRADDLLGSGSGPNREEDPQARAQILLGLGRSYENLWQQYQQQGKTKEAAAALSQAIDWYSSASDSAADDRSFHERLQQTFTKLGRPDLAQKEQEAVAEIVKAEAERNRQLEEQQKAMERSQPQRPTGPSPVTPQKP